MKIPSPRLAGVRYVTSTGAPDPDPDGGLAAPLDHRDTALRELRDYLGESRQHLDAIARALRDNGSPAVLETRTITIPANIPATPLLGYVERSYRVPYAAVMVANLGLGGNITATSAAAQNGVPGGGQGQIQVPPCCYIAQNISGQALTLYGPPGTVVTYSVLVNRIQPSAGLLNGGVQTLWTNIGASGLGQQISANGGGPVVPTLLAQHLGLLVTVTAAPTGTAPTLTVAVDTFDSAGNAYFAGATVALTAPGTVDIPIGPGTNNGFFVGDRCQVTWTVGGTTPVFPNVDLTLMGRP